MPHRKSWTVLPLLLILGGTGCPGWPAAPPDTPAFVPSPAPDVAELLLQEQGAWLYLSSAERTSGVRRGQVMQLPPMTLIFQGETEIGREQVRLEIGTDSSRLPQVPTDGCFSGLVWPELVPLPAYGPFQPGCKRPGYEQLQRCPHHPAWRMPVYLGAYSLADHWGKVYERKRLLSVAELASGRTKARPLGRLCDQAREVLSLPIPLEMFEGDGRVRLTARLTLILDSREATELEDPRTFLRAQLVNR